MTDANEIDNMSSSWLKKEEPLEHEEQVKFTNFLIEQNLLAQYKKLDKVLFSAIANGHYQSSYKQRVKLKAEGLNPGVPDMLLVVPANRSKTGKAFMMWVEMKRLTLGSLSAAQKEWIDAINSVDGNLEAFVCKGGDKAIETYSELAIVL